MKSKKGYHAYRFSNFGANVIAREEDSLWFGEKEPKRKRREKRERGGGGGVKGEDEEEIGGGGAIGVGQRSSGEEKEVGKTSGRAQGRRRRRLTKER